MIRRSLVLVNVNPSGNPRPRRLIQLLRNHGFEVDLLSRKSNGDLGVANEYEIGEPSLFSKVLHVIRLTGLLRKFAPYPPLKNAINERMSGLEHFECLSKNEYDLLVVESIEMLPIALRIKRETGKILCDLREYYPREFENSFHFRFFERGFKYSLCKHYLNKCDALISVSPGLVAEFSKEFNLNVSLIRSTPSYVSGVFKETTHDTIRMVYHGGASRDRKLENIVNLFDYLDGRFLLDFYLTGGDTKYKSELLKLAARHKNIRFLDPVPFNEIIPMLRQYDVGLCLLETTTFNLKHCLPNKLFEFIQARLIVVTGPSPDIANLVNQYNCGIVAPTFNSEDVARVLNMLTVDEIVRLKQNSDLAAKSLCFEEEGKKLIHIIEELLRNR